MDGKYMEVPVLLNTLHTAPKVEETNPGLDGFRRQPDVR